MRTTYSAVLAVLVVAVIGAAGITRLPAQAASSGSPLAYYISEFELTDAAGIKPYSAQVASTFEPFGGRYIVRGGKIAQLEGEPPKAVVVIAFDSMEQALGWYESPAYREIRPIRHKTATSRVYIVEGIRQ